MRAICILVLVACASPPPPQIMNQSGPTTDDDRLIARVRDAVHAHATLATIEAAIGAPATFTTATHPIEILRRTELVTDPEHPTERFVYADAAAVVYWTRPVEAHDPKMVGVIYGKDGSARMFFAIVLPP
jgi:hypothetical protein